MHPVRTIGRAARVLAGLAAAVLAGLAVTPAALASTLPGRARLLAWPDPPLPLGWNKHPPLSAGTHRAVSYPPGWNKHPPLPAHVHALATGGMTGWQIALIAAGATVLAAAVAVLLARAARRKPATVAASVSQASSEPASAPVPPGR